MRTVKNKILTTAFLAFVASTAACAEESTNADYSEVCREEATDIRVEDEKCENRNSGFAWAYVHGAAGRIGHRISNYTSVRPTSGSVARAPSSGGFGTFKGGSTGG